MKYLSTGFQISIIIFIMFFFGWKIDELFDQGTSYFSLTLALITILAVLIKLVTRVNKRK